MVFSQLKVKIESFSSINRIGYRKRQISLSYGDKSRLWIQNRANGQVSIKINPINKNGFKKYLDSCDIVYSESVKGLRFMINPKKIESYSETLKQILPKVYDNLDDLES